MDEIKCLNLGWCKALSYAKGELGSWVSEQYLCLVRVAPWFYSRLVNLKKEDKKFVEPKKSQENWTKKENSGWLKVRNVKRGGSALEIRARVAQLMRQAGGPPQVCEGKGCAPKIAVSVMTRLSEMIALMMQKQVQEETLVDMEFRIKLFLSAFERLYESLRGELDNPKWLTSYNFCRY